MNAGCFTPTGWYIHDVSERDVRWICWGPRGAREGHAEDWDTARAAIALAYSAVSG